VDSTGEESDEGEEGGAKTKRRGDSGEVSEFGAETGASEADGGGVGSGLGGCFTSNLATEGLSTFSRVDSRGTRELESERSESDILRREQKTGA
jgi:hypothetical protein